MQRRFRERRGRRGGGDARSGLQRKETVGPADRAGPPVSEGQAAWQAGPEGKGERWATAGPEGKGGDPAGKNGSGRVVGRTDRAEKGRRPGRNRCLG
jgi:hypothetical protein